MKHLDEYRNPQAVAALIDKIKRKNQPHCHIMEICGGQTHSIIKNGLQQSLSDTLTLLHGPGCPVCVTPIERIDAAINLARQENVILCSYGDMLRVPGSQSCLLEAQSEGGHVQIVYSPEDCLTIAQENPHKEVVFLAIGFETTAAPNGMAVYMAGKKDLTNFSMIVSHVRVPPALSMLLAQPDCRVQGILAAGHVCAIMGYEEYFAIAREYKVPIVITGFEPLDILSGIDSCMDLVAADEPKVVNNYDRYVSKQGNLMAQDIMQRVFLVEDMEWRGLGIIPKSGLALNDRYRDFDALKKWPNLSSTSVHDTGCRAGEVMQGIIKPYQCPRFGKECYPESPLGAPMVSSEGACAAYYQYHGSQTSIPTMEARP